MNSSAHELLNIIEKYRWYPDTSSTANRISDEFLPVSELLSNQWRDVGRFFQEIQKALENNLLNLQTELQIYAQSQIAIDEELEAVVREVAETAKSILEELKLISN